MIFETMSKVEDQICNLNKELSMWTNIDLAKTLGISLSYLFIFPHFNIGRKQMDTNEVTYNFKNHTFPRYHGSFSS